MAYDDYILVACPFCAAGPFQDCVKVRGPRKGQPASQTHVVRSYAYSAAQRRAIR